MLVPVKNNWKRPIRVGREVIPKGGVVPVPEHLLLQPRVQKLRRTEKLIFPFYEKTEKAEKKEIVPLLPEKEKRKEEVVVEEDVQKDDLTQLIHIGEGRLKILNEFGIFTFDQVIEHADNLSSILEITEDQAYEVVEDAKSAVE
jgi:predicted flap endonuclease-1-like 5' DNA nuclease